MCGVFCKIQPQVVGFSTARLPLPFDVADDGLIFVNAKQYNGILRRRQMRAKLVAQNRLLKTRKVCKTSLLLSYLSIFNEFHPA